MNKWISVKDKLPEIGDEVLTFNEENCIWLDFYVDLDMGDNTSKPMFWSEKDDLGAITHWMPLPDPPENEER